MADKHAVNAQVLREAVRLENSETDSTETNFLGLLGDLEKQKRVFDACIHLLNEEDRRRSVGIFLLYYLPGLPLLRSSMDLVYQKASQFSQKPSSYQLIFKEIKKIIEYVFPPIISSVNNVELSSQETENHEEQNFRTTSMVPIILISDDDVIQVAQYRNKHCLVQRKEPPLYLRSRGSTAGGNGRIQDYIYQCPLVCEEKDVERYIRILNQLWDRYKSNPNVIRASSFLLKQMCDGYVSKVPFGAPYVNLRSVSMCFLPTMLEWMEADYLCIRHHVYDFLITLGTHLQLLDSQNVYPGLSHELQREFVWLVLNVLQRQILVLPYDEMTWTAAAKCILAVLPRSERSYIDCRVFFQILNISNLAELHPDTFGSFAEAFVQSLLLRPEKRVAVENGKFGSILYLPNAVDEREFAKLGKTALSDILTLYRRAYTVGGRLWLFKLVFILAAKRLRIEGGGKGAAFEAALRESFECFVAYGFFWHWHSQLFYIDMNIRQEVIAKFSMASGLYTEYTHSIHSKLLDTFLSMAETEMLLPEDIAYRLSQYESQDGALSASGVADAVEDALQTSRLLLKTDSFTSSGGSLGVGGVQYNIAWRLLLYCLDSIRSLGNAGSPLLRRFIQAIVTCEEDTDNSDVSRVRRVLPDLLTSEFIRWRAISTNSANTTGLFRDNEILEAILEGDLFSGIRPFSHRMMALYYHFCENVVEFEGTLYNPDVPESTDMSFLLMDSVAVVQASAVNQFSLRFLWSLYKGLSSETALSACRARQVLVSIMAHFFRHNPSSGYMWRCIIDDAYPPVALIGATTVVENYNFFKDSEEKRVFSCIWQSLYSLANNVVLSCSSATKQS